MTISGFNVSGAIPRSSAITSASSFASRRGVSASSTPCATCSAETSDDGLPLARFSALCSAESTTARSASKRSPRTVASSSTGFASAPKQRITTASASTSRSFAMPCADETPPGTSTNRTWAATVFFERSISVRTASRGSGTDTTATFAWPPCDPERVRAVNRVDFPENGTPTSPMSFTSGERISRLPPERPGGRTWLTGRTTSPEAERISAVRRRNSGRSVSAATADTLPM